MANEKQTKPNETSMVECETSAGPIAMEFHRDWSPHGYDRAIELFERGFFDKSHFFRVVPNFLVQFGISYTADQDLKKFAHNPIPDDPQHDPVIPFVEGTISYAGSGDNSRTSQMFISYGSSTSLGTQKWETPLGTVVKGMDHVRNLYHGYGDGPPFGKGPAQGKIHSGPRYIEENFPLLDHFKTCTVKRGANSKPKYVEPKHIREERREMSQHKRHVMDIPLEDKEAMPMTKIFAAFAMLMLVLLLIFGYRHSGRKGSKSS